MTAYAFTKEEVLAIHSAAITMFGGVDGVRDEGLLDSAMSQPFQTFDGHDLYPTEICKACRYAFGIMRDHPFLDGNKRTGTALLGVYLRMYGFDFKPIHQELLETMMGVADGSLDFDQLVQWTQAQVVDSHSSIR